MTKTTRPGRPGNTIARYRRYRRDRVRRRAPARIGSRHLRQHLRRRCRKFGQPEPIGERPRDPAVEEHGGAAPLEYKCRHELGRRALLLREHLPVHRRCLCRTAHGDEEHAASNTHEIVFHIDRANTFDACTTIASSP